MLAKDALQLLLIKRPYQDCLGAESCCFSWLHSIVSLAKHEDTKIGTKPAQPAQNVQTVAVAARKIEHKHAWGIVGLHAFHRFPTTHDVFDLPGVGVANGPQHAQ